MKYIDISTPLNSSPGYPGDPKPSLRPLESIENGDLYTLSLLTASLHSGTHIDAPCHFIEGGVCVDDLDLDLFLGECTVATFFSTPITGADIDDLFVSGTTRFLIKGSGHARLSVSAAHALAAEGVRLIGIDAPTVGSEEDDMEVHRILLREGIVLLEGLNLRQVHSGHYFLIAPPVRIDGAEAAFCRALLVDGR